METCTTCGLPDDLCVCDDDEPDVMPVVEISFDDRRHNKTVTLVEIENSDDIGVSLSDLASHLKSSLACGGTAKEDVIELQGRHKRDRVEESVKEFL